MEVEGRDKADRSSVRSALRALELLECFTPARREITLTDLARETKLPTSTTARLLSTLVSSGYLRKTDSGRYACAARLLRFALATLQGLTVWEVSQPHLEALRDATGETANLVVPGPDGRPIYVRQAESSKRVRHKVWLGETLPLEGTATGDAMSGKVNDEGYAIRKGSIEPDVAAIASPVRDVGGEIVGVISITMPLYRASDEVLRKYGLLVAKRARAASADLGWRELAAAS